MIVSFDREIFISLRMRKLLNDRSGQMLMIAMGVMVLLLLSLPVLIKLGDFAGRRGVQTRRNYVDNQGL